MKITYTHFIAKANKKGNKKSILISVLMFLLVTSLSIVSTFSITVSNAVKANTNDYRARITEITPGLKPLDDKTLSEIRQIEHVESVNIEDGLRYAFFMLSNIADENGTYDTVQRQIDKTGASVQAWSLIGNEKRNVIAGKSLEEAPVFSCIIPHLFYPFADKSVYEDDNLNYIDSESLIGKTITVESGRDGYYLSYDYYNAYSKWFYLPNLKFKLKIVGVYYTFPTENGGPNMIYISEETGRLIQQAEIDAADSLPQDLIEYLDSPELHTYHIVIDDRNNLDYVYSKLDEMNVSYTYCTELLLNPTVTTVNSVLSGASILLVTATLILCLINIINSTTNSIMSRTGEIGLMKAVGYKNHQIFGCLAMEQLMLTLRAFLVGAGVSAVIILIANYINSHSTFPNRLYIVNWTDYLIFLVISLIIATAVPLICQMITLNQLTKIQPKDAMNAK